MHDNKNVRKILDKAFWDGVLKLRNDMLNAYKKEIEDAKKLENMTQDERIAYWAAQREKERIQRRDRIAKLSLDQRVAVIKVYELVDEILDTALYPDMGGVKAITAYDLQELSDAKDRLRHEFNFDVREHG